MNCKLCYRAWDLNLIRPEVLLPCAHTFCWLINSSTWVIHLQLNINYLFLCTFLFSECLDECLDLSCPDCGSLICDRKLNTAVYELIDQQSSALLHHLYSQLNRIESSESMLQINFELKQQNSKKQIETIEHEIERQVQKQLEMIFSNQARLREALEFEKNKINHKLNEFLMRDELHSAKLELIKSNLKNSTSLNAHKLESFLSDLNKILEHTKVKLNEIHALNLNVKFECNDLVIINSQNIVGQIVGSSCGSAEPSDLCQSIQSMVNII